jgi:ATP phosphoribosyltransferase
MTDGMRIALPSGKSLESNIRALFADTGITLGPDRNRADTVRFPDYPELMLGSFVKPSRIPSLVASGAYDIGICGLDSVGEAKVDVRAFGKLPIGRETSNGSTRVVLFGDKHNPLARAEDIKPWTEILSEYPNLTAAYFKKLGLNVRIVATPGSCEAEVPHRYMYGVTLTDTGRSLRDNGLRELAEIATSATALIISTSAWESNLKFKVGGLYDILLGTLAARGKVKFEMNVTNTSSNAQLVVRDIAAELPSLGSPTISPLACGGSAISVVCSRAEANKLTLKLSGLGVSGFIVTPIISVIP